MLHHGCHAGCKPIVVAWETKSCAKKNTKGIHDSRFSSSNNDFELIAKPCFQWTQLSRKHNYNRKHKY